MEIRAYPETYVANAMNTMGTMLDYAVNFRNENIDFFFASFVNMGFARQFEIGNPDVITGKSGVELYRMIKGDYYTQMPQYLSFDRSPQFWLGWALAYYQWYTGRTFRQISGEMRLSEMLLWYPTLHEADLMRFVEALENRFLHKKSNLQRRREMIGLSQTQLAYLSGVSLRSIQMYEQKQNDISRAQFNIISALAEVLNCMPYELMDNEGSRYYSQQTALDPFQMQLMRNIERHNQRIARLQAEQREMARVKQEVLQNKLRYGYISQFPYQSMNGAMGNYYIQRQPFIDNWNRYWRAASVNQSAMQQQRLDKIARELLSQAAEQSRNPYLKTAYDSYCLITADTLMEAVSSAIKIIETAERYNQGRNV